MMALERNSRPFHGRAIAVDLDTKRFVSPGGPPLREKERTDILRIVDQQVPISLVRGAFRVVGPMQFERGDKRYALFLLRFEGPSGNSMPFFLILFIAIATTSLLSWLFAKSLTRPILRIQKSARSLAAGEWQSRVENADSRQDELGQLARDFNKMANQLNSMWTGQKRLLADISHELRSPLARLQMALGLAHQQNVDPASLVRIEREAGMHDFSSFTLSLLLKDVFTDGQFEAANSNKMLDIEPIPKLTVTADQTMLCRAVENVLRNALRHANYLVEVSFAVTDKQWSIIISDDGSGLSKEECKRIFAPFYRASLARERESGGVGLGLSIAKASVELHDGTIQAEPGEKHGLVVTLSFPKKTG